MMLSKNFIELGEKRPILWERWATNSVVLVSGVQQRDSVILYNIYYIYTLFKVFFSTVGYYKVLNIVSYAIQWDLLTYLFYI